MEKNVSFIFVLWFCAFLVDVISSVPANKTKRYGNDDGNKIIGGYDVTIQEFPYLARLLLKKKRDYYQCGGSIISASYILTAAHCLTKTSKVIARVGSTDADSGGTEYTSRNFQSHPRYRHSIFDYDVGYVRFTDPILIDGVNTAIVTLAESNTFVQRGTYLTVIGWGATSENGNVSENLMAVQVPVVSSARCRQSYNVITSRMICAAEPEGGKDACGGDSGGPAVSDENILIGIVSNGIGCARPGIPGVYTNVSSVRDWVRRYTGV